MIFKQKSPNRDLVVVTVNGYLQIELNWICWSRRSGFSNFLFLAEDSDSYNALSSIGIDSVMAKNAPQQKPAAEYGSKEFQDTMTFHTGFPLKDLENGLHVLTGDAYAVWLDDPFKYADPKADLQSSNIN